MKWYYESDGGTTYYPEYTSYGPKIHYVVGGPNHERIDVKSESEGRKLAQQLNRKGEKE